MGFGYLLIGYILAFLFSLSQIYFFTDIIGALVMLLGLSKLAEHQRNFYRAMWVDIGYLLVSTALAILRILDLVGEGSVWNIVFSILVPLVSLVLQFFIFAGIFYLAQTVELNKEASKSRGAIVRTLTYYILSVIAFFVTPLVGKWLSIAVANITSLVITLYGLLVIFMNIALLHTCYCRICLSGQENGERPQSKYEWVNKMNEKTDKMFDGAFLRPDKKKKDPAPAEESEPGYLRVKRKKQKKHKK